MRVAPARPVAVRRPAPAAPASATRLPMPGPDLVKQALSGPVRFRNNQSGEATLAIAKTSETSYRLTLDGKVIKVGVDAGLPAEEALARIAGYFSQLPPHMRDGLQSVEVTHRKKEGAAATAYSGKRVVFWDGMKWLKPNVFFHELGHVNAQRVYGHTDPSDAWDRAEARDKGYVSDYAKTNDNEDFAEMMEFYWMARRGEGKYTLEQLRAQFPERMKIIEDVVADRSVDTKDTDYWRVLGADVPKPATIWRRMDGEEMVEKAEVFLGKLKFWN